MLPQQPPAEYVYEVSNEKTREALRSHFQGFYSTLAENKFIPNAGFETCDGIQRCLTGIPYPFQNAVFGFPNHRKNWDQCITNQLNFFNQHKIPFVWYVDENSSQEFKDKLLANGFQNIGIFRGVAGNLDKPILSPEIPNGYILELVKDEAAMEEFNDLVCTIFGIPDNCKEMYKTALWRATNQSRFQAFNWIARKDGRVVSAVTTLIDGDHVSFWNGATIPELRKTGLSTALRRMALQDAISRGCRVGSSYLMAEGLAYGICSKFGYETRWRFNAFLSPSKKGSQ